MPGFEIGEELPDGSRLALSGIYWALADTFLCGVLHDASSLSLNGERYGPLALFELLHKGTGPSAEGGE